MTESENDPHTVSIPDKNQKTPSKLDPYSELITLLITKGTSLLSISEILQAEFQLKTSPANIHSFLKTRRKRALREYTYNAIQAIYILYVFTKGSEPSYIQLIEDLTSPDAIPNLYNSLHEQVQPLIQSGDLSYVDQRKYETCFRNVATHWLNLPTQIKSDVLDTLQHNTPNNLLHFLKKHISKPERAKPEYFHVR